MQQEAYATDKTYTNSPRQQTSTDYIQASIHEQNYIQWFVFEIFASQQ